VDIFYWIGILCSSTLNFYLVNRMLITCESSVGAFLHLTLLPLYLVYYTLHIIISYTCWVPTISVLNLAIFPLLLKPAAQKEMMDWNSSMRSSRLWVAPGLPFLWCYRVFRYFVPLRVVLVCKDFICVIIVLYIMTFGYLWALLAVCVEQMILGHAYDEYSVLA
jgi:hypothetical protein